MELEPEKAENAGRGTRDPVAAAVLAGGLASRMGWQKAGAMLAGKPLVVRAVETLGEAGLDPFVITREDRPVDRPGVPVVIEPGGPRHPLAGVAAAIEEAGGRDVIVLACDLPLLPPAYLAWLAGLPQGSAVPMPGGEAQPLAARYSPADLAPVRALLEGELPAREVVEAIRPRLIGDPELAAFGDPGQMFFNVNTPGDLRRAERMLTGD